MEVRGLLGGDVVETSDDVAKMLHITFNDVSEIKQRILVVDYLHGLRIRVVTYLKWALDCRGKVSVYTNMR